MLKKRKKREGIRNELGGAIQVGAECGRTNGVREKKDTLQCKIQSIGGLVTNLDMGKTLVNSVGLFFLFEIFL